MSFTGVDLAQKKDVVLLGCGIYFIEDNTIQYSTVLVIMYDTTLHPRSTPVAQSAPRNLLTRWDVSSIPANGIFLTKN